MIDVADNNKAYYYHFDGLGSVVALSNSNGDSCQSYEYSAYGQVAASDPNFLANPYMFTGRRFDIETGLYYYRARYYNPHIGRFMQTDPVGYGDGINWYAYCGNNPLGRIDPSGLGWVNGVFEVKIAFYDWGDPGGTLPDGTPLISGSGWKQAADDSFFDIAIDIRQGETWGYGQNGQPGRFGDLTDFVIRELGHPEDWAGRTEYYNKYLNTHAGDYSKLEITDVYIFDHGNTDRITIGDEVLISGTSALTSFLGGVGNALMNTGPDATIHFRGCKIGDPDASGDRPFLKELAAGTGHTSTGIHGHIQMRKNLLGWYLPRIGPDYTFEFGLYQATPGGTVTTLWKNELRLKYRPHNIWIWYNPWGPQPY